MKHITLLFFTLVWNVSLAQKADTIRFTLASEGVVIPGIGVIVQKTNPPAGATTNAQGTATVIVPQDKNCLEVHGLEARIVIDIIRPVDSIYFDINSRKASFFFERKLIKTKRQSIKNLN